jgi:hypothetical protein
MVALRQILASYGFTVNTKPLTDADAKVGGLLRSIRDLGPALSVAALVGGFRAVADSVGELEDTARSLTMPIGELQAWERWADRSGIASGEIVNALQKIQRSAAGAADGSGELSSTFDALGINVNGAGDKLKTSRELLVEVLEGLKGVTDETKRTDLAMDVFGRSGGRILRALGQGDVAEFIKNMDQVGAVSEKDAAAIGDMDDALKDAKSSAYSLSVVLISRASPFLKSLFDSSRQAVRGVSELTETSSGLTAAATVLATVAGARLLSFGAKWIALNWGLVRSQAAAALPIVLAVVAIEELITTWQGGDSAIRRAIDGAFGSGSTAKVVDFFRFASSSSTAFWGTLERSALMGEQIVGGAVDEMGGAFAWLWSGMQDGAAAAWDFVISKVQGGVTAITALVENIPGFSGLSDAVRGDLEKLKNGKTDRREGVEATNARRRVARVSVFEDIGASISRESELYRQAQEQTAAQGQPGASGGPPVARAAVPVSAVPAPAQVRQNVTQRIEQTNRFEVKVTSSDPRSVGTEIGKGAAPHLARSFDGASASLAGAL